jgi:hypothetical protein
MMKPVVMLHYQYFANDCASALINKGMPGVRLVPESVVPECTVKEEIESEISKVMDDIIDALTRPLTEEEKSPKPKPEENIARIIFKGDIGEVNRFFYQRGWADGLPVLPPTEEAVAEMLTGTDLPPDYLVAEMEPRRGKTTVEKIAINAVMAGALPTYMPVLIAGVKALQSGGSGPAMMAASTGSFAPVWIVNGPVRNDLHINSLFGAMSPGDMANSAIGRAMRLIVQNMRGMRKGMEDMGCLGNPGKFALVVAENEEANPWAPLHVERDLNKEDSAITYLFSQSFQQLMAYATDDKGILSTVAYNMSPGQMGAAWLILTPLNAKALASRGWTKKSINDFVVQNASAPKKHFSRFYAESDSNENQELMPIFMPPPGTSQTSQPQPSRIQVVVFGGMGSWVGTLSGGQTGTAKIDLPANWDKLVAKYKNVVPTYARY